MLSYHISAIRKQTDQERRKEMRVKMRMMGVLERRMLEEIGNLMGNCWGVN